MQEVQFLVVAAGRNGVFPLLVNIIPVVGVAFRQLEAFTVQPGPVSGINLVCPGRPADGKHDRAAGGEIIEFILVRLRLIAIHPDEHVKGDQLDLLYRAQRSRNLDCSGAAGGDGDLLAGRCHAVHPGFRRIAVHALGNLQRIRPCRKILHDQGRL